MGGSNIDEITKGLSDLDVNDKEVTLILSILRKNDPFEDNLKVLVTDTIRAVNDKLIERHGGTNAKLIFN